VQLHRYELAIMRSIHIVRADNGWKGGRVMLHAAATPGQETEVGIRDETL
jgi:hypothetical protein